MGQGLTLAQVAGRAGLSMQYLSNLELGRGNPTLDVLGRVVGTLGHSLDGLFDASDAPTRVYPRSLVMFARSAAFGRMVDRLAVVGDVPVEEIRKRVLDGLAAVPTNRCLTPLDYRRVADAFWLVLSDEPSLWDGQERG